MQTADQNRMDMCRPRLALILGHTLKIESENSGNGMALRNVIPAPECRITCKEGKVAVFVHSLSVCACIHLCVCVCVAQWRYGSHKSPSLESIVSAFNASCFIQ